jgi:hypothetical protein
VDLVSAAFAFDPRWKVIRMTRSTAPVALNYLPGKDSFLDALRVDADRPQDAGAVVIPFGLEASVSYGSGTKAGPQAILAASQQLELFDEELWREPYKDFGIAARRPRWRRSRRWSRPYWRRARCRSYSAASMR